ncbi:MAG: protein kinase [Myxococcales bacterium]
MKAEASELPVGQVVGGRYRIESLLGSGGMGVLYVAEHLFTHRRVALKLLHPERGDDLEQLQARFLTEARTASAVRHPHVVDVLDMGTDEEGMSFLVMELLEGFSLDRLLKAEKQLSPSQALAWILPIMGALAVLHDAGIVHRDIKPSNLFLCQAPSGKLHPKVLDFGLARVVSDLRLTRSGVVIGTPLYMAPEHAGGLDVGPQADVWSLGVVLYECLAGRAPYQAKDGQVLAAQVLAGHVQPLHVVRPDLPTPLAHAVERALRRDLALRYQDMRDFAKGLLAGALASGIEVPSDPDPVGLAGFSQWLPGFSQWSPDVRSTAASGPRALKQEPSSTPLAPSSGPHVTLGRASRNQWIAVVALSALLLAGLSYALWGRADSRRNPPAFVPQPAATLPMPGPEPRPTVAPLPREDGLPEVVPLVDKADEAAAKSRREREGRAARRRRSTPEVSDDTKQGMDIETEWK